MTSRHPRPIDDSPLRAERRKQAPIAVVQCSYRLAKACQLYDDANQTVQQLTQPVVGAVDAYCSTFDCDAVRVVFSSHKVLVNRRMLRTSREAYELALQLGTLLDGCNANEMAFERGVATSSVRRFFRMLVEAQRQKKFADQLRAGAVPGASIRRVPDPDAELDFDPNETPVARVVKTYATAIVIVQSFYEKLSHGDGTSAREVKRVAHKLVALVEEHPEWVTAAAAGALLDSELAKRAVSTAIIALAMARVVTEDRAVLATLSLAALTADVGIVRSPQASRSNPADAVIVLADVGQYYPSSIRRNVVVYEALSLPTAASSQVDGMMSPTSLSSILFVARRFNAIRSARPGAKPLGVDAAIDQLSRECRDDLERSYVRLLVVALGFVPPGTVVELDTGEVGTVTGVPKLALDFARPPVRIVTDVAQRLLAEPFDVDLARQPAGMPTRSIRRVGSPRQPA